MMTAPSVEERLATLEQVIKNLDDYIKNDTQHDLGKLEGYLREYEESHREDLEKMRAHIDNSNVICNRTFRWMIGIFASAFVSLVMLVVMLCRF